MLSISSTFHEIEQALREKNIKAVKSEMSVGENKLRRVLIAAGYEYDTSLKRWRYVVLDESKDVRNMSFWAFDEQLRGNTSNTGDNMSNKESNISNTESNTNITKSDDSNIGVTTGNIHTNHSNNSNTAFSPEEIAALKEIAQLHSSKQPPSGNPTILESIKALESDDTDRKTFVIDKQLISQLDAFCELHRVRKSDVMSVAIYDLLQKYK